MVEFHEMLAESNICIATQDNVPDEEDYAAHDRVVVNLLQTERARVVVCFCEGNTIKRLLRVIERRGLQGHFLLLGR